MPVTAKLSRRFYEALGDDVANELVEWFNAVDATYRSDLRDLNELNFARFDAKLEQRAAQLDAKIELRFGELDAKMDRRFGELDAKMDRVIAEVDTKIAELHAHLERRLSQTRWSIIALLVPIAAGVVGLYFTH